VFIREVFPGKLSRPYHPGVLEWYMIVCLYGRCFLVNSADRIIRVYESGEVLACGKDGEPEPIQKLQDLVNK